MTTFKHQERLNKASMVKVDRKAYRLAMRDQHKVKPDAFPVGNRKARRLDQATKRKE